LPTLRELTQNPMYGLSGPAQAGRGLLSLGELVGRGLLSSGKEVYGNLKGLLTDPRAQAELTARNFAQNYIPTEEEQAALNLKLQGSVMGDASPIIGRVENVFGAGVLKGKKAVAPFQIADVLNLPESAKHLFAQTPGRQVALARSDPYLMLRQATDGQFHLEYRPAWGMQSKPFSIAGNDAAALLKQAQDRIARSDKAIAAAQKSKHERSLLGRLQSEFGDNFQVQRSQRSKSQYITHEPSGVKIRISDHSLPLGYEQADVDLPIGMSTDEMLAEIRKHLE
jgi:hypothetical protein